MDFDSEPYNKNYYDNLFHREVYNSRRNKNRLKVILSHHQQGKMLEIGCGKGQLLRMAARNFEVEGIDISRHAVESLSGWKEARVRQENVEYSQIGVDTYQVVAAFNVLEHIRQPGPVIDKIHKSLRPGGILVGSVPFNASLVGRVHTLLTNLVDRTHVSTLPPRQWRKLFDSAGFQDVNFFGEIMLGKNINRYLHGKLWTLAAFNLMFVCTR